MCRMVSLWVCISLLVVLNSKVIQCYQPFVQNNRLYNIHQRRMRYPTDANLPPPPPPEELSDFGWTGDQEVRPVKDFVTIENPPTNVKSDTQLKVKYQCGRPLVIAIFIDGYENDDNILRNSSNPLLINDPKVVFKRGWTCSYSADVKRKTLSVKLPKRFLYQPNILMPKISTLEDVKLKVFMAAKAEWNHIKSQKDVFRSRLHILYERSKLKLQLPLLVDPPGDRTESSPHRCLAWQTQVYNDLIKRKPLRSRAEEECSDIVKFPIVLSEEPYGVIQGYQPFYNPELKRQKRTNHLRMTLTVEMYLKSWCKSSKFCSIFHHIDKEDRFETPIILLSPQGQLSVQMKLTSNQSFVHTSPWSVPLNQWVRLHIVQANVLTNVTLLSGEKFSDVKTFTAGFHKPVSFVESNGFMVVGGTIYCTNVNSIISFTKFCRNKIIPIENIKFPERPDPITDRFLVVYRKQQNHVKNAVKKRWNFFAEMHDSNPNVSVPYFLEMINNCSKSDNAQCMIDDKPLPSRFANIEKVLKELPLFTQKSEILTKTRDELYKKFLLKMEDSDSTRNTTDILTFLKQSAKLGHGLSHFFLYSIYKNGVAVKKNLLKARFHLLTGAHAGDRMCIKALAYSHLHGLCGFPKDIDISFFYFFNLAHKTQKDLLEHSETVTAVNMARLTDEKKMKLQLSEEDDLFQWIKHQATKGAYTAQRNMGRLLYWGQQGLQRNLDAAFKYYEEAAKGGDPVAMYDYGIVLLKGHGTDADAKKGVEVLQQAAELKNPGALNTLGWYYTTKEVNMTKAMEYFEQADQMGSIDAAYNLGHMYHTGKYPGKKRDLQMAFKKYYRAAAGGHTEAGLQVAYLTATGIEDFLPRNTYSAVQWSQYLTERNPTMGELVREGLQAYRKQSWLKALLIYMAIAETGFEIAQYNTAFLCESHLDELTDFHIEEECVWKNWNASSSLRQPHPYALNKMGDYHYYGHGDSEPNLEKAVSYYGHAARLKFPQALFNLASILEKHGNTTAHRVMKRSLEDLSLPEEAFQSTEDTIVHLYKMCSNTGSVEMSMPCYIALVRTQTVLMWNQTSQRAKVTTLVIVIITTLLLVLVNKCWSRNTTPDDSATTSEERLEGGEMSRDTPREDANRPGVTEEATTISES